MGSQTSGFDALIAVNQTNLNLFLYNQWATSNPNNTFLTANFGVMGNEGTASLANLVFDTPYLSFSTGGSAEVDFNVPVAAGSWYVNVGLSAPPNYIPTLYSAVVLQPSVSGAVGAFPLALSAGSIGKLGAVTFALGNSSGWSVDLDGISSTSETATSIATGIQTFYASNPLTFSLGEIQANSLPTPLVPTSFSFAGFPATSGSDAAIVYQIVTTGNGGSTLTSAPTIPSGSDIAVIVNGGIVAESLQQPVGNCLPADSWSIDTSGSTWVLTPGGSQSIPVGAIDTEESPVVYTWSTNSDYEKAPVMIPVTNFQLFPSDGQLAVNVTGEWSQPWESQVGGFASSGGPSYPQMPVAFTANDAQLLFSPTLVGSNSDCTFSPAKTMTGSISAAAPSPLKISNSPGPTVLANMLTNLTSALQALTIPSVNLFALGTLVTPGGNQIETTGASLPWDLVATGNITQPFAITASATSVGPGGTVTLSCEQAAVWSVFSGSGTISPGGGASATTATYTAPPRTYTDQTIVIQAAVGQTTAFALLNLVLESPSAIQISPACAVVPMGGSATFDVVGATDSLTVSITPTSAGKIQSLGSNSYALIELATTGPITITADSGSVSAVTEWQIVAADSSLAITPSAPPTLTPGQTLQLSATCDIPGAQFYWAVVPTGSSAPGTISTSKATSDPVTYTAPATIGSMSSVWVTATCFSPDPSVATPTAMAFSAVSIPLNSSG